MPLTAILRPTVVATYDSGNWINQGGPNKAASLDPGNPIAHDDLTTYLQIFTGFNNRISFFLTGIRPAFASIASVTGFCRWRNINNYNPNQQLNLFTRRLAADSANLVLTGGGDGVGNFTTLSGAIPRSNGGPWTPTDIADGALELGMYVSQWQLVNPNEINATSLWIEVVGEPVAQQISQAREIESRFVWNFHRANPMSEGSLPLAMLDAELLDEVAVTDIDLPYQHAVGEGSERWRRGLFRHRAETVNLENLSMSGTLEDIRAKCVTFVDLGRSLTTGGPTADGVLRLDSGNTRLWTRPSKAWVPDPSDGLIRELQDGWEKMGREGMLFERASTNGLTRSTFISQLTGWTVTGDKVNGSDITADITESAFEPGVTGFCMKLLAGNPHAADLAAMSPVTGTYGANARISISVDYRAGVSDANLFIRIIRNADGWYWNGTAWQSGVFNHPLPAVDLTPQRAFFEDIDVGSSGARVKVQPVLLSGGTASRYGFIYDVLIEEQRWCSESRIVTDAATYTRAIDSLKISNSAPLRCLNNPHGSVLYEYIRKWGAAATNDLFYFFDLPYDANNGRRFYYRNSTSELVYELKVAGQVFEAKKLYTPPRNGVSLLGYRWTSSEGELGLAPYTASVFAQGEKGDDVVVTPGMPIEADSYMYIGGDSAAAWSADGVMRRIRISQLVYTDAEMARGGP